MTGLGTHLITRRIEIDAAHRVPLHESKCRSIHGHRYVIEAACQGPLCEEGSQSGMVLDFGFLKEEMVRAIETPADHGFLIWKEDAILASILDLKKQVSGLKVLVLPCIPTAEELASYWYKELRPRVAARSQDRASLTQIRVYETPNCWADYPF